MKWGFRGAALLLSGAAVFAIGDADQRREDRGSEDPSRSDQPTLFTDQRYRGRVGWMAEALSRRHGVTVVSEAEQSVLALETADGHLHPLLEDTRGRAFRRDPRLRGVELELLARRHHGSPMLQVIQVFEVIDEVRQELDYWCEICAIAMFELKPCDCCQGDIELRRRALQMPPVPPALPR